MERRKCGPLVMLICLVGCSSAASTGDAARDAEGADGEGDAALSEAGASDHLITSEAGIDARAGADAAADAPPADASPADVSGDASSEGLTPDDAAEAPTCGFVMPNPAGSELPNAAVYDTSSPDVVTDQVTGLMWERSLHSRPPQPGCHADGRGQLTCPWRYAKAYCENSQFAGFSDWRLPTIWELVSLVDSSRREPALNVVAFPDALYDLVTWSSTRITTHLDLAWTVALLQGTPHAEFIDDELRVRCVRYAALPAPRCYLAGARFALQGDYAFDNATGLTWQRTEAPNDKLDWMSAKAYCATLGAGFRLPTASELATLVDYTKSQSVDVSTIVDTTAFPVPVRDEWSSTIVVGEYPDFNRGVWVMSFSDGHWGVAQPSTTGISGTRCVR